MCAINPAYKKRMIFDFYTSDKNITKEEFEKSVIEWSLTAESEINKWSKLKWSKLRVHAKESKQKAD